jgi:hypothetical protein
MGCTMTTGTIIFNVIVYVMIYGFAIVGIYEFVRQIRDIIKATSEGKLVCYKREEPKEIIHVNYWEETIVKPLKEKKMAKAIEREKKNDKHC